MAQEGKNLSATFTFLYVRQIDVSKHNQRYEFSFCRRQNENRNILW